MMNVTTGLFYLFSLVLLGSAFRVITARNPVHAVLFLVLTFFQASMIWMLLKAEFLALSLILVYVGAVMVLFLFVVMMLDFKLEVLRAGFWNHFPLAVVVGVVIALEMAAVLMGGFRVPEAAVTASSAATQASNAKALGQLLYSQYFFPLEVATAVLLVAMFAAIALTLRHRKDTRAVHPADQIRVRAADRLVVVKMDGGRTDPSPQAPAAE